jgi:hypothetical protein
MMLGRALRVRFNWQGKGHQDMTDIATLTGKIAALEAGLADLGSVVSTNTNFQIQVVGALENLHRELVALSASSGPTQEQIDDLTSRVGAEVTAIRAAADTIVANNAAFQAELDLLVPAPVPTPTPTPAPDPAPEPGESDPLTPSPAAA